MRECLLGDRTEAFVEGEGLEAERSNMHRKDLSYQEL